MIEAPFLGDWKITHMEVWSRDYIDLVVPGFISFEKEGAHLLGSFQFGTVSGGLDCRVRELDGKLSVEWSWEGENDNDPGCGRGWAQVVEGKLVGRIYVHGGDDSAFEAQRKPRPTLRRSGRTGTRLKAIDVPGRRPEDAEAAGRAGSRPSARPGASMSKTSWTS